MEYIVLGLMILSAIVCIYGIIDMERQIRKIK